VGFIFHIYYWDLFSISTTGIYFPYLLLGFIFHIYYWDLFSISTTGIYFPYLPLGFIFHIYHWDLFSISTTGIYFPYLPLGFIFKIQEKMENIIFSKCIMEKGDKPKASKTQSEAKPKVKKPRVKKTQKQTQKQSQEVKQTVKIVLAEKKPKRKYVRKPKPKAVRGTTSVSTIIQQDTDGLAQVITPIRPASSKTEQTQAPAPKPPAPKPPLLSAEQAPTTLGVEMTATSEMIYPVEERKIQEPVPKKATKARAKKTFTESIGDFIKKNLLDQPADLHSQEADRPVEMPRPPLTIVPESPPVKPKPKRKQPIKGITDVPISIVASKEIERQEMGMEDIDIGKQTPTEATEKVSLQDPDPASFTELNESLRRLIVSDTIDDIIGTIETPVFSENPDFKTISQNVEIESAPSSMVDYGNEGLTELGVEGFVPVGNVRGMVEEIERRTGGRPRKYETEEQAREAKREQTLESNRKARAEKKLGSMMERYIKQERLNVEYGEFVSEQEKMDNLTEYLVEGREAKRRQEEQISATDPFKGSAIYVAEETPAGSDFLKNEVGALTRLDNYGKVQIMENDELGYSDETPVLTTALFSKDAVGSNFPEADIEFL
jgi:hypothetical protein